MAIIITFVVLISFWSVSQQQSVTGGVRHIQTSNIQINVISPHISLINHLAMIIRMDFNNCLFILFCS